MWFMTSPTRRPAGRPAVLWRWRGWAVVNRLGVPRTPPVRRSGSSHRDRISRLRSAPRARSVVPTEPVRPTRHVELARRPTLANRLAGSAARGDHRTDADVRERPRGCDQVVIASSGVDPAGEGEVRFASSGLLAEIGVLERWIPQQQPRGAGIVRSEEWATRPGRLSGLEAWSSPPRPRTSWERPTWW